MTHISKSLEETKKIAHDFLITVDVADRAVVVALAGDLGSGKTTFTKAVAEELGVADTITSPTFVIEKINELSSQKFKHLIHIDAYRLERAEELVHLGWNEIISDPSNLILIEWPERVPGIIPENARKISFKFIDETTREISI